MASIDKAAMGFTIAIVAVALAFQEEKGMTEDRYDLKDFHSGWC